MTPAADVASWLYGADGGAGAIPVLAQRSGTSQQGAASLSDVGGVEKLSIGGLVRPAGAGAPKPGSSRQSEDAAALSADILALQKRQQDYLNATRLGL